MRAIAFAALVCFATSLVEAQDPAVPIRAKTADGRVLNLDFEKGDLRDWTAEGKAFEGQPIKGDTVNARRGDMKSEHAGDFWVGTYEKLLDEPQGTLTSVAFTVTHPWASFLIAGGSTEATRVEVVRKDTGKVVFKASGHDTENLERVVVELVPHVGQEVFLRVIDAESGGWGHINFDDFQFYTAKPAMPKRGPVRPADLQEFAGLSGEEAAKAMKLPDGFTAKIFASEPDVVQPIAMTIDERGRVWVAEAHSYPVRVPEEQAKDRILIFEDTDNDGKFDNKTVFVDNLNLVSGLEVGFGGVWVGAAPELLFIPDGDRDDKPDGPATVVLDGWGYEDTHETLNSFIWGPDGWLYGCHGVFTHSKVGKPGTPDDERVKINAGIWRYHPTRHQFEVFAEGTSNPWGVDFNDMGQSFLTCCVIPHLFHVVQGGRFQRQAGQHFNEHTYADIQTIAKHRHWVGNQWNEADRAKSDQNGGGHAHAGAMIYLGHKWPKEYSNQLFMNNIHGARLNLDLLSRNGSGYVGDGAPDFCLTNDRWSQILYLRSGPDGNVFLIDWYDANQCHHGNTAGHDRSNGRIFKICYENPQGDPVPQKWKAFDLGKSSNEELIALQTNPNDWWARTARRVLQERAAAGKATADLAPAVDAKLAGKTEQDHLRRLWTLHAIGALNEDRLRQAMEHDFEFARAWAIQFACELGQPTDKILEDMAVMARADKSSVVRLYLASALQRLPLDKRWDILVGLLSHGEDANDHNLPLMLWYAAEPLADADSGRALEIVADGNIEQVLEFMVRRVASKRSPEALAAIVQTVNTAREADSARSMLVGLRAGLRGRRQVPMPEGWAEATKKLAALSQPVLDDLVWSLSVTFGDKAAIDKMRTLLADDKTALDQRKEYIATLLAAKDAGLLPLLKQFLNSRRLRAESLRGLAAFEDSETSGLILGLYAKLSDNEKRDALNTLASRPMYALALMKSVAEKKIAPTDITADLARQLRNLKNEEIDALVTEHWGLLRDSPEEKAKLIAEYKELFERRPKERPDPVVGRAVFAKVCAQCHMLFNAGGKVGPELTGSNRKNLEYLLSNVLDPSAVLGKDYRPLIIETADGRVLTGLVKARDANSVTLVTANETVIIPKAEIEEEKVSEKSMMPDDLLKPLKEHEVRSLVAYLGGDTQQPLFANKENAVSFFNGKDLVGWDGDMSLWRVENGEIIGTSPGLKQNEFLRGPLVMSDFTLTLQVKLTPNEGNSGIQFRSEALPGGEMKGYQADVGVGWWGKLYEEHGRALLWDKSGEAHVKPGEWNDYTITARGSKITTTINGHTCVDLDDPEGAKSGLVGLQLHSGGPFEVRFRNIKLEVDGAESAPVGGSGK